MSYRRMFADVRCATALATLLAAALLCWGREGLSDESAAARLFREGRALLVEGRLAEACAKLEQSQRLEPRLGTKLNVAFCQEQLGKLATAWRSFQEAASLARGAADSEREQFARSRVAALEPRVPRLLVRVATGAGANPPMILLDGVPLSDADEGEPLLLDPGVHVVVAWRGSNEYWRTTVTLGESEHMTVSVPAPPPELVAESSAEPRGAGHFVYELGAFIAYMDVDTSDSEPAGSPSDIRVDADGQTATCATSPCTYLFPGSSAGFAVGVSGFLGYSLTGDVDLGFRFLLGPRAGGGALVALGPSMSFVIAERYELSPAVLFGNASYADKGFAELTTSDRTYERDARLSGSLGFAIGLGAELGWTLTKGTLGSVVLQATPLFLYGSNGLAWALPLGAAFRWN